MARDVVFQTRLDRESLVAVMAFVQPDVPVHDVYVRGQVTLLAEGFFAVVARVYFRIAFGASFGAFVSPAGRLVDRLPFLWDHS